MFWGEAVSGGTLVGDLVDGDFDERESIRNLGFNLGDLFESLVGNDAISGKFFFLLLLDSVNCNVDSEDAS